MTYICRTPFAHDADTCDCRPSKIEIDVARFNRSAALRSEQARLHRTLLYAFLVVLAAMFIGAITPQAMENIKAWEVAYEPV